MQTRTPSEDRRQYRVGERNGNNSKDIYQAKVINDEEGRVLVGDLKSTRSWWMKKPQEKEGTSGKQTWRMTLQRSLMRRLKRLSGTWIMGKILDMMWRLCDLLIRSCILFHNFMPCTVMQLAFLVVRANTCLTFVLYRVSWILSKFMWNIVWRLTGKHPVLALYIIIAVLNSIRSCNFKTCSSIKSTLEGCW